MVQKILLRLALALVLIAGVGIGGAVVLDKLGLIGDNRESRNSEVVSAITREQKVVLLSMAIQGLDIEKDKSDVLGWNVPGTTKTAFLQYSFDAKLGIDGEAVDVEKAGEKKYVVTIPEFAFIGFDNVEFDTVAEDNGVISAVTSDIDTAKVITEILNDDTKSDYLAQNDALMRDQAKVFYEGIIRGIDPEIDVEFVYAEG